MEFGSIVRSDMGRRGSGKLNRWAIGELAVRLVGLLLVPDIGAMLGSVDEDGMTILLEREVSKDSLFTFSMGCENEHHTEGTRLVRLCILFSFKKGKEEFKISRRNLFSRRVCSRLGEESKESKEIQSGSSDADCIEVPHSCDLDSVTELGTFFAIFASQVT